MNSTHTVYRPAGRVVTRRIGEDNLLVPVSGGAALENVVFPVNNTGLFIWERIIAGKTIDETAQEMSGVFDVEKDLACTDCEELVQTLMDEKLLEAVAS